MSDAPLIEESSLEERRAFIKDVFTFFTSTFLDCYNPLFLTATQEANG